MPRYCRQCGSEITDRDRSCPDCGVELAGADSDENNEFKTEYPIDAAGRQAEEERLIAASRKKKPVVRAPEPEPEPEFEPEPRPKPRPKPAEAVALPKARGNDKPSTAPARSQAQRPVKNGAAPSARHLRENAAPPPASPPARPVAPQPLYQTPVAPEPQFPPQPQPRPRGIRKFLIRMLGGQVGAPPEPASRPGAYPPPGWTGGPPYPGQVYVPPPGYGYPPSSGPGYSPVPAVYPSEPATPSPGTPLSSSTAYPAVPSVSMPKNPAPEVTSVPPGPLPGFTQPQGTARAHQSQPYERLPFDSDEDDEEVRPIDDDFTEYESLDVGKLKLANKSYVLQIFSKKDPREPWENFGWIVPPELNIGRSKGNPKILDRLPGLRTLAERHMRFVFDGDRLFVEPIESLNGVYVAISETVQLNDGTEIAQAVALENGQRFRVGRQVLEFRLPEPIEAVAPQELNGEIFHSFDLLPQAYVVLIRPDGNDGLHFPITKEETLIGRKDVPGANLAIALTGDRFASKSHARVVYYQERFWLQNLSAKGTYVAISGRKELRSGDQIMAGAVRFRVALLPNPMQK